MDLKNLTPEQWSKVDAAKTPEEILAIVQEEGYELSREELDSISGGDSWYEDTQVTCINCGYTFLKNLPDHGTMTVSCPYCGSTMDIIVT